MNCPECSEELKWEDSFGNLDHCLDAIGHPRDFYSHRKPIKKGDIYYCESCECHWHELDERLGEILHGYPC